ncbi:hypothetical protein ACH434_23605 [Lysinibacillus fusiformis]|uniref:hypothetical protein n=1 Tax=Lysinibacillus fusiformis TaxID=28031 RepID=UPI0037BAA373
MRNKKEIARLQPKRMGDFSGDEANLLFRYPLYSKIKINTTLDKTFGDEIIDYNDNPFTITKVEFIENLDVRYLKTIAIEKKNFIYYCPFCKKEKPIIQILPKYSSNNEILKSKLSTYTGLGFKEEIEEDEKYAIDQASKNYRELIEKLFDENNVLQLQFECTSKHRLYVYFQLLEGDYLIKTGQYPSILMFNGSLNKFKKLTNKEIFKELTYADNLITQSMGVGAFLYLRRILEKLIFQHAETAIQDNKIDEQTFMNADTIEKVKLLKKQDCIPNYLADVNPFLYPILSKGVHELDEDECISYYDTLKKAIILILDEVRENEEKIKLKNENKNAMNNIHSTLKNNEGLKK